MLSVNQTEVTLAQCALDRHPELSLRKATYLSELSDSAIQVDDYFTSSLKRKDAKKVEDMLVPIEMMFSVVNEESARLAIRSFRE